MAKSRKPHIEEDHLYRVRRICESMPAVTEKLSHGAPTFFAGKKVMAMFTNNHHNDGRIAVWIPAAPGVQAMLVHTAPETFFKPPYVGVRGWLGIKLDSIGDEDLSAYLREAWLLAAPKKLVSCQQQSAVSKTGCADR